MSHLATASGEIKEASLFERHGFLSDQKLSYLFMRSFDLLLRSRSEQDFVVFLYNPSSLIHATSDHNPGVIILVLPRSFPVNDIIFYIREVLM